MLQANQDVEGAYFIQELLTKERHEDDNHDSDMTVNLSEDQDVGFCFGGSSEVEEVDTSFMEERSVVHAEEQQSAKVVVLDKKADKGKVHEKAVEEQTIRREDHEQHTVDNQFENMCEGTPPSPTLEQGLEPNRERSPISPTSSVNNRFFAFCSLLYRLVYQI